MPWRLAGPGRCLPARRPRTPGESGTAAPAVQMNPIKPRQQRDQSGRQRSGPGVIAAPGAGRKTQQLIQKGTKISSRGCGARPGCGCGCGVRVSALERPGGPLGTQRPRPRSGAVSAGDPDVACPPNGRTQAPRALAAAGAAEEASPRGPSARGRGGWGVGAAGQSRPEPPPAVLPAASGKGVRDARHAWHLFHKQVSRRAQDRCPPRGKALKCSSFH